jgi:MacB-like periplasmic core domain
VAGSVTGGIGVRMALEPGHGRSAVPVRSALIGITVAVTSVVAAVVFGASLIGLVDVPHRYGQNWAQVVDFGFGGVSGRLSAKVLSKEPAISGYAAGNYGQLSVGTSRTIVPAIGIDPVHGRGFLTLLAGRAPSGPDEIVLGAQTLRAVHATVGQRIRIVVNQVAARPSYARTTRTMRIVGVAVFPLFGRGSFSATDLGTGAAVAASVLSEVSRKRAAPGGSPATASCCCATGRAPICPPRRPG